MTNREVAEVAFISPKTVEANLSRVYRKLGIRSRAELGARMAERAAHRRRRAGTAADVGKHPIPTWAAGRSVPAMHRRQPDSPVSGTYLALGDGPACPADPRRHRNTRERHKVKRIRRSESSLLRRTPATIGLAAVVALALASPAGADRVRVEGLTPISGATPFPDKCGVQEDFAAGSEGDPRLAVNPRDPRTSSSPTRKTR